jgi:hypothetical protein
MTKHYVHDNYRTDSAPHRVSVCIKTAIELLKEHELDVSFLPTLIMALAIDSAANEIVKAIP